MDLQSMDKILSIVANFLTAGGILGFIYWWTNKRYVRLYLRVPQYAGVKWKMLYIRDGGEVSNIENKELKFKKYKSKNPGETIIGIKVKINPRLGFQFKCFAELTGTDRQNKAIYPELKSKMMQMGFNHVEGMAYDGKVWFLVPEEYKIGTIKASPVENIINNIWYPTLSKVIYPYVSISTRVPLMAGETDLFTNMEYYIESYNNKAEKQRYYFDVVKRKEMENCALIKASIKITSEFKPLQFKVFMHPRSSVDSKWIFDQLQFITDNKKEDLKGKLSQELQEFSLGLKNNKKKRTISKDEEDLVSEIKTLRHQLHERKQMGFIEDEAIRFADIEMKNYLEVNSKKSLIEQARIIQEIMQALDFEYNIEPENIDNEGRIEISFVENFCFRREKGYYYWEPGIKKGGLLNKLKPA